MSFPYISHFMQRKHFNTKMTLIKKKKLFANKSRKGFYIQNKCERNNQC